MLLDDSEADHHRFLGLLLMKSNTPLIQFHLGQRRVMLIFAGRCHSLHATLPSFLIIGLI